MTRSSTIPETSLSRRNFLKASAALGGGLLLGFHIPLAQAADATPTAAGAPFAPNAYIRIDRAGKVTIICSQVEMGQGAYTSTAMIIAEELDVPFAQVSAEAAPPSDALYANPIFGIQVTGNSNSVRAFWPLWRKAGAAARAMLVEAAAQSWSVDPAACRTEGGAVIHDASGRKMAYGDLVDRAATLTPPKEPALKAVSDFKLIGQPAKRLDTPDKVNGKALYGIDAMPEGVKFATLIASPVFGGKIGKVDDTKAKAVPGVRQVIVLDDLVAVVGDHMWAAKQGLDALDITWNDGANAENDTTALRKEAATAADRTGAVAKARGDGKALDGDGKLEADYRLPFLAHAPMEPMNCTVHVAPESCEIWVGTQILARAQSVAAGITGLPVEKVIIHNYLIGGGFGRRLYADGVAKAVRIAQHVDGPVKVVWTREEDIRQDMYRPIYHDRLAARVEDGKIVAWNHRIVGSALIAQFLPPAFQNGIDIDAIDGAADLAYDIPNFHVEYVRQEPTGVPVGFWRGVGPNQNVFAIESFIDELAHKAGKDPVAFRRDMLGGTPRLRAALDLAATKSGWSDPLPKRVGRGVAIQTAFTSHIATVAEAEVDEDGEVLLRRVTCVVDCGIAVNPDTVVAQLQGGLIFGLTAALYGGITIEKGRVQQSNFNDYRMLRINQIPAIEVHIIPSTEFPGGMGECGVVGGPPALNNAIFAATGIRLRHLPIDRDILAGRKQA